MAGRVVKVVLEDEGKPIQETELTLDDIEGSQKVEFEFTPDRQGPAHLHGPRPADPAKRRSPRTTTAPPWRWSSSRASACLYIEGTLRGEYGAIVDRFLAKDPDLEFCALIQTRPNVFLTRTNIEGLELKTIPSDADTINKFDVFILGDLDSTYLKPQQQQLIVQRVRNGGGLVMLGGYHALGPGGYAGTPIGEVLPVLLGSREIGQVDRALPAALDPRRRAPPDLRQHRRLLPHPERPAEAERAAGAGRLHAGRGGPARRHGPGASIRRTRARCRSWPSSRWTRAAPPSSAATRRASGSRARWCSARNRPS